MIAVCVGNDVVDLESPRTRGRAGDDRFVERVFAETERAVIRSAPDPDLELWCHWAAKEAGFKAISKRVGEPPPFVHRAFVVSWEPLRERGGTDGPEDPRVELPRRIRAGRVRWREHQVPVSVALHPGSVHAVAHTARESAEGAGSVRPRVALLDLAGSPWAGSLDELLPRFTTREADAVYSLSSAAVRVGARSELAELLGVPERRLEIVCAPGPTSQRPPRVLLDGRETAADVSLSHDGRLIAWALWVGSPQNPPARNVT